MSGRIEKARAIRAAVRKKRAGNPYQDVQAYEMGLSGTVSFVLCLLFAGAAMATVYIVISNYECMKGGGVRGNGKETAVVQEMAASPIVPESTTAPAIVELVSGSSTSVPVPSNAALLSSTITECTSAQMEAVKKSLPDTNCLGAPFTQSCSFTVATVKSGCQENTGYYRQPIAGMTLSTPFSAVMIGTADNDDTPMDLLVIGSHNPDKYRMKSWNDAVGDITCPKPGAIMYSPTIQTARLFVVEEDQSRIIHSSLWKAQSGLTDADLKGESTRITKTPAKENEMTLADWVKHRIPTGDIHYLRITVPGARDYEILTSGGTATLDRVWYLEFFLDWKDGWSTGDLKGLLSDPLSSFACYWHGAQGNLWRITGCWQNHYDFKSWAKVVCVNSKIAAAKPIYDKMEEAFAMTLTKDKVY